MYFKFSSMSSAVSLPLSVVPIGAHVYSLQVFDVLFNGETVVSNLDIFSHVGFATAHDEHVPFSIKDGSVVLNGKKAVVGTHIPLTFASGPADNPKICAFLVSRATVEGSSLTGVTGS